MAGIVDGKIIYSGFKKFINFLKKDNIINIGIGFILAASIKDFIDIFVNNIMMPFVNRMFGPQPKTNMTDATDATDATSNMIKFKNRTVYIFGINFGIGEFVIGLVQFIIILYIVYLISIIPIFSNLAK